MRITEALIYSRPLSRRDDINTVWYLAHKYDIRLSWAFHLRRIWVNGLTYLGVGL